MDFESVKQLISDGVEQRASDGVKERLSDDGQMCGERG